MRNVWILLLTLTISTFFIHVPHVGQIGFIFNAKVVVSYNQYVWLICQHLQMVIHAAVIWDESKQWPKRTEVERGILTRIYSAYVWLQVADAVMFVLAYDDPLKDKVITWNIIKLVIFIIVIGIESWNRSKRE